MSSTSAPLPAPRPGFGHRTLLVAARLVEVAVIALGVMITFTVDTGSYLVVGLPWLLLVLIYLGVGMWLIRRSRNQPIRPAAQDSGVWRYLDDPRIHIAFSTIASLVGITAGLNIVASKDLHDDAEAVLVKVFSVLLVVMSWMLLHAGYARFYRGMLSHRYPGGLVFPECPWPGPVEFAYFSYTVGVSFAVSDVEVVSRPMRWHLLVHSLLSFFFNTAVIAVAISVITG